MELVNKEDLNNYFVSKHPVYVLLFFFFTPIAIVTCLISLLALKKTDLNRVSVSNNPNVYNIHQSGVRVYASLPASFPTINGEATVADARPELIRNYLNFYHSPLEKYSQELVNQADLNNLDYRLLTAISQQESNLCKIMPESSFNCWGWGIHSKGTLTFSSYEEAIATVSKGLAEEYIGKGLQTPDEIMTKYTPLSNGSWAEGVNKFMAEIENGNYF